MLDIGYRLLYIRSQVIRERQKMSIRKLGQYWAVYSGEQAIFTSAAFPYWVVS